VYRLVFADKNSVLAPQLALTAHELSDIASDCQPKISGGAGVARYAQCAKVTSLSLGHHIPAPIL
jgi:hypothetical protein